MPLEVEFDEKTFKQDIKALQKRLNQIPFRAFYAMQPVFFDAGSVFVELMQAKHLSGGTTSDRLAIRSGTLFDAIHFEVKGSNLNTLLLRIYFGSEVDDYAPVQEFGSEKRNIPPRMSLREEWASYVPIVIKVARQKVDKGI